MNKTIFLKEVLEIMDKRLPNGNYIPFDIVVREFSRNNKTGGKIKYYNDAKKLGFEKTSSSKKTRNITLEVFQTERNSKNPNHFENSTRNIELATGEKKKINIQFIIKFNNLEVIY